MDTYTFTGPIHTLKNGVTPSVLTININATSGTELIAQIVAAVDAQLAPLQPEIEQLEAIKNAAES